jgi:NADH-quinone oxidoreductase subunit K
MTITINHYLIVSFLLFSIGFLGVLVRRNFLTVLMSVELMMNAVNLNLIAFSRRLSDLTGHVFSIFVITIAAGEAAIGLALTIALFRQRKTLNIEEADTMRG